MGKVSNSRKRQVESQLQERGMVVWYDPVSDYELILSGLEKTGLPAGL